MHDAVSLKPTLAVVKTQTPTEEVHKHKTKAPVEENVTLRPTHAVVYGEPTSSTTDNTDTTDVTDNTDKDSTDKTDIVVDVKETVLTLSPTPTPRTLTPTLIHTLNPTLVLQDSTGDHSQRRMLRGA